MITNRLPLRRTARSRSRSGFTLVELLVVIGIIAILAGVALGPITNVIKQAKHNTAMQQCRQLGQICFAYSTDNNQYPSGTAAINICQTLANANYVTDPALFVVTSQTGSAVGTITSTGTTLTGKNVSYSFTQISATSGITSDASDLLPLVFFNNGPSTAPAFTYGASQAATYTSAAPFGTDGAAVYYKGNSAAYLKAGTGGTVGSIPNFITASYVDTGSYVVSP